MARPKKKGVSDLAVVSGLVFAILGALVCSMLFVGEARTYGQLVAVALGSGIGQTDWWKAKPAGVHYLFIVLMGTVTLLIVARQYLLDALRKSQ